MTFLTLVISQEPARAGELTAALQAAITPVATNTPAVGETNSFLLSFSQRPVNFVLGAVTSPAADLPRANSVGFVLTQRRPLAAGLFGSLFSIPAGSGNVGILNFEAGYGQAYDPDSVILHRRNGTGLEEPRYIFFKRVVKF